MGSSPLPGDVCHGYMLPYLSQGMCDVMICCSSLDTDVSVGFVSSAFNVTEGEGQLEACVEMTGFSAIPLSLTVSTWPDTAIGMYVGNTVHPYLSEH